MEVVVPAMASVMQDLIARVTRAGAEARFSARALGDAELQALLGAARVAPSADNLQTWRFVVVRDAERRRALAQAAARPVDQCADQAPVMLVACGVRAVVTRIRNEQPFVWIDVPIAITNLLLEATELGLAYAWTLEPDEARVRQILGIPDEVRVIALCALGWPEVKSE